MRTHQKIRLMLFVAAFLATPAAMAESVVVKSPLVGCTNEAAWSAFQVQEWEKNQQGVDKLLAGEECLVIPAGAAVEILRPGVLTATVGYREKKLFTRADALRR